MAARNVHTISFRNIGRSIICTESCSSPVGTGFVDQMMSFVDEVPRTYTTTASVTNFEREDERWANKIPLVVEIDIVDLFADSIIDCRRDGFESVVVDETELGIRRAEYDESWFCRRSCYRCYFLQRWRSAREGGEGGEGRYLIMFFVVG